MAGTHDTYQDLINSIKDQFGDTSAETNTTIRRRLMPILRDIWSRATWVFARKEGTITTAASTEGYSLASDYDFGGLYDVVNDTDKNIVLASSDRTFDSALPAASDTGVPTYYRLWGTSSQVQQIQFYPIPSGVKTITYKYYRRPTIVDLVTDTTNDSQTPDLPVTYRQLLVDGVLRDLYLKDESGLANVYDRLYENGIKKMRAQYATDPDTFHIFRSEEEKMLTDGPTATLPSSYGPYVNMS